MKKLSYPVIATGIIVILAVALIAVLLFLKNQPPQTRGFPALTEIAALEPDSAKWGVNFPNQYASLLKTKDNNTRTTYGGSEKFSRLEDDPRLVTLWAGYSFSKEYNEDRGHMNSVQDAEEIKRINETSPATCYSCKSSDNPRLWTEMGMREYDKTLFSAMGDEINNPIGCANCHEAGTMRLVVTNPALNEALQKLGKDWTTFTRQEMRTVVCANCHVEYYFAGDDKYLTFPWGKGTNIDQIVAYYQEVGFKDWDYPDTGIAMLKGQHPEYETYTMNSTHYLAGVACADCHMPYTRDGALKYSSHDVHSPLLNPDAACGQCHTNVEYVVERVAEIQKSVNVTLLATEDALIDSINAIKVATASTGVNQELLAEARNLHREAQMRWDFVSAENSMGFHNPEETLRTLAKATNQARQAQILAMQAVGK